MIYVLYVKKIVKNCHKDIRCKTCKGFVHKKCTNLKPKYIKSEEAKDWVCQIYNIQMDSECNVENDTNNLNETHLKDKPNTLYNIPGFNVEYTNRIDREKGGVCLYIYLIKSNTN